MIEKDKLDFSKIFEKLYEVYYPDKAFTETLLQTYFDILKDIKIETIIAKAERHLKTERFFPKPVDLRPKWNEDDGLEITKEIREKDMAMRKEGKKRFEERIKQGITEKKQ